MKIRIYSPFFPFPISEGAYQVIYDQARTLVEGHDVELVVWKSDQAEVHKNLQRKSVLPFANKIHRLCLNESKGRESPLERVGRVGRAFLTGQPSPALFYYPTNDRTRWLEVMKSLPQADLGIYHYSFASLWNQGLNQKPEKKTICYLHNLESDLFTIRAAKETNPLKRMIHERNARKLWELERDLPHQFDELWFISDADLQDYRQRYSNQSAKLKSIPPSFDPAVFKCAQEIKKGKTTQKMTFGFLGKLDFEPNRVGIMWVINEVAPILARKGFEGQIWIGGKNTDAEMRAAAQKYSFIQFKGFIENLTDWYRDVDIALAPHFSGSGTRIKLLDALAFATPVLCHPATAHRIAEPLRHLPVTLTRETASDWAETMLAKASLQKTIANFATFPEGLDGQKIYSAFQ